MITLEDARARIDQHLDETGGMPEPDVRRVLLDVMAYCADAIGRLAVGDRVMTVVAAADHFEDVAAGLRRLPR